jgi:hypothetical protein
VRIQQPAYPTGAKQVLSSTRCLNIKVIIYCNVLINPNHDDARSLAPGIERHCFMMRECCAYSDRPKPRQTSALLNPVLAQIPSMSSFLFMMVKDFKHERGMVEKIKLKDFPLISHN